MAYPIRALSFGEIFDQSFRLMREHFALLTAGFVVSYAVLGMLHFALSRVGASIVGAMLVVATFAIMALLPLVQLVATILAAQSYVGDPMTFQAALERAKPSYLGFVGTTVLALLGIGAGMLLLIVPGLYLFAAWSLIAPIVVLEGRFGTRALTRSRELVSGHFWRTFAIFVVSIIAGMIPSLGLEAVLSLIPLAAKLTSGIVDGLWTAYLTVVTVVLYMDLRCRHEDFDLQLMAREVADDAPPPARGHDAQP